MSVPYAGQPRCWWTGFEMDLRQPFPGLCRGGTSIGEDAQNGRAGTGVCQCGSHPCWGPLPVDRLVHCGSSFGDCQDLS